MARVLLQEEKLLTPPCKGIKSPESMAKLEEQTPG
jgi:hypothetical protein